MIPGLAAVGLVPGDCLVVGAGDDGQHGAGGVEDAESGLVDFDGDDLAGVGHADGDVLVSDLDAATGGHLPLDPRRAGRRGGRGAGEAGVANAVSLLGRDRAGQGAGQDAVEDQVQKWSVQAEGDTAAGVLEPDRDRAAGNGDNANAVGGAVDLDRQPGGQRPCSTWRRWRPGRASLAGSLSRPRPNRGLLH